MPTNDFKPFATAGGANVSTQAEYLALAALSTGWQSGKASSKEINKAVRQATFIAAALAQFVSDKGAVDVLDDGNLAGFGTKLITALNKTSQPLDATLTALAALVGAANKLPYFNGADTAALTDLTQVGRDIIGKSDIAAVLTYLGLGSAAQATLGYASGNAMKVVGPGGYAASANAPAKTASFLYERSGTGNMYDDSVCVVQCPGPSNQEWMQVAASFSPGRLKCWVTRAETNGTSTGAVTAMELWHDKNTTVDTNGFIKKASPIVKLFTSGEFEVNAESEGCVVTRNTVGEYIITGCLGLSADSAWGGTDGGFEIPTDRNKQPRIWLDYEVKSNGSVLVKTFHRTHPDAPEFAQNVIDGMSNGDPIDIPADSFVSVRVEMPIDSINNQKVIAGREAEKKAVEEAERIAMEPVLPSV